MPMITCTMQVIAEALTSKTNMVAETLAIVTGKAQVKAEVQAIVVGETCDGRVPGHHHSKKKVVV